MRPDSTCPRLASEMGARRAPGRNGCHSLCSGLDRLRGQQRCFKRAWRATEFVSPSQSAAPFAKTSFSPVSEPSMQPVDAPAPAADPALFDSIRKSFEKDGAARAVERLCESLREKKEYA